MLQPLSVAALQGAHFLRVQLWDGESAYPKPAAVWANTVPATSARQLRVLHWLQAMLEAHPELQPLPLATAILQALDLKAASAKRPWLPQTHFRELTQLDGALGSLGKYATNTDARLRMSESDAWRAAKTAWQRLSIQHQPVHQAAASCDDIATAMSNSKDPQLRAFLMLLWLSCGRKGDVASLRQGNVTLEPSGRLNIFMQEGKGVLAKRAKYHVITHVPELWRAELRAFLATPRERRAHLFRRDLATNNEVTELLRTADPALNCRATRRGAAQTMARSGAVTEDTLMRMTGHRSLESLHRYLDWDRLNEAPHRQAQEAAKQLTAKLNSGSPRH